MKILAALGIGETFLHPMEVIWDNTEKESEGHFISFLGRGSVLNVWFSLSLNMPILITEVSVPSHGIKNFLEETDRIVSEDRGWNFQNGKVKVPPRVKALQHRLKILPSVNLKHWFTEYSTRLLNCNHINHQRMIYLTYNVEVHTVLYWNTKILCAATETKKCG